MEINVDKTKVMRISKQPSPINIMINKKTGDSCEIFELFGEHDNELCKIPVQLNSGLRRKSRKTFQQQIGLNFKEATSKVLQLKHRFVWS
jgi:hypothetical protein